MRVLQARVVAPVTGVREHFSDLLRKSRVEALGDIASRVVDHLVDGLVAPSG